MHRGAATLAQWLAVALSWSRANLAQADASAPSAAPVGAAAAGTAGSGASDGAVVSVVASSAAFVDAMAAGKQDILLTEHVDLSWMQAPDAEEAALFVDAPLRSLRGRCKQAPPSFDDLPTLPPLPEGACVVSLSTGLLHQYGGAGVADTLLDNLALRFTGPLTDSAIVGTDAEASGVAPMLWLTNVTTVGNGREIGVMAVAADVYLGDCTILEASPVAVLALDGAMVSIEGTAIVNTTAGLLDREPIAALSVIGDAAMRLATSTVTGTVGGGDVLLTEEARLFVDDDVGATLVIDAASQREMSRLVEAPAGFALADDARLAGLRQALESASEQPFEASSQTPPPSAAPTEEAALDQGTAVARVADFVALQEALAAGVQHVEVTEHLLMDDLSGIDALDWTALWDVPQLQSLRGNCSEAPPAFESGLPVASDLPAGTCVLTVSSRLLVFNRGATARNVWLDHLYVRYTDPAFDEALDLSLIDFLPDQPIRPRLWLTFVTLDGGGGAAGLIVEHADVYAADSAIVNAAGQALLVGDAATASLLRCRASAGDFSVFEDFGAASVVTVIADGAVRLETTAIDAGGEAARDVVARDPLSAAFFDVAGGSPAVDATGAGTVAALSQAPTSFLAAADTEFVALQQAIAAAPRIEVGSVEAVPERLPDPAAGQADDYDYDGGSYSGYDEYFDDDDDYGANAEATDAAAPDAADAATADDGATGAASGAEADEQPAADATFDDIAFENEAPAEGDGNSSVAIFLAVALILFAALAGGALWRARRAAAARRADYATIALADLADVEHGGAGVRLGGYVDGAGAALQPNDAPDEA